MFSHFTLLYVDLLRIETCIYIKYIWVTSKQDAEVKCVPCWCKPLSPDLPHVLYLL